MRNWLSSISPTVCPSVHVMSSSSIQWALLVSYPDLRPGLSSLWISEAFARCRRSRPRLVACVLPIVAIYYALPFRQSPSPFSCLCFPKLHHHCSCVCFVSSSFSQFCCNGCIFLHYHDWGFIKCCCSGVVQ
jgi:hypothetical protein